MAEVKLLERVLKANEVWAEEIRRMLRERRIFCANLIGSPGSGKTTLLEKSIPLLGDPSGLAVIEGDLATSRDADRIGRCGVDSIQIATGTGCHIDAHHVRQALDRIGLDNRRMIFIENVGNLVCPAEFDIGEHAKVAVLSVPEGDEKPLKYPPLFQASALVVLTKTDLIPYTDFSRDEFMKNVSLVNPTLPVMEVCCKTGDGIDRWTNWLEAQYQAAFP